MIGMRFFRADTYLVNSTTCKRDHTLISKSCYRKNFSCKRDSSINKKKKKREKIKIQLNGKELRYYF